jgi:hypothetical protein
MLGYRAAALLLIIASLAAAAAGNITTEGGNITAANITSPEPASLWAAIVGTLNNTNITDYSVFISSQAVQNASVYYNEPNGTYATLENGTLILTRLGTKPDTANLTTPALADFMPGGMFSNFTMFASLNYSLTPENPHTTFSPFPLAICVLDTAAIPCPYITTNPNKRMGLLKFDNGTTIEPVFVEMIRNDPGFNGSNFDFQFIVPANETYYFYTYLSVASPPFVQILTPLPAVYPNGNIQLTYNITDPLGISSCWYQLDNATFTMPSCTLPVNLTVAPGTHTLILFANNTVGLTNQSMVTFTVRPPLLPEERPPSAGGGGTHTPYPQPIPPQPVEAHFTLSRDINVTIDYPREGASAFYLSSSVPLDALDCRVSGDFADYSFVTLPDSMAGNSTATGTLHVAMTPGEILDYSGGKIGALACAGRYNGTWIYADSALIRLTINLPAIMAANRTFNLSAGSELNASVPISNIGAGNATAINITFRIPEYPFLVKSVSLPQVLGSGESAPALITISAPQGMEPGTYATPIVFYENGRQIGYGLFTISVYRKAGPEQPAICVYPDLRPTLLILLAGLFMAIITFRHVHRDARREEGERLERLGKAKAETDRDRAIRFRLDRKAGINALAVMALFFSVWVVVVTLMLHCIWA